MELGTTLYLLYLVLVIGLTLLFAKLVHANRADWGPGWLNAFDGLVRLFVRRFHRARLVPIPLPERGPALVVCNHVSGLDPFLLVAACNRPLRFLIATEQYSRRGLTWLFDAGGCIPVDRHVRPQLALYAARRALRRGEVVALFPHGKIHLDSDPPRKLKRGVARLSRWLQAPVYTCRIDGVAGQGYTMEALLMKGEPQLRVYPVITCSKADEDACMDLITERIEGRLR